MSPLKPIDESAAELFLRTYYTTTIALLALPPELIFYICQLAQFVSPWPDHPSSATIYHHPSKFQRTIFRTTEPRKIVSWFRTPPISHGTLNTVQRVELHARSHAPYPASRALGSVFYNPSLGGIDQRRVPWHNFSLRLVSPADRKQPKTRTGDGTPLSWPCFGSGRGRGRLPPEAEPQPSDPGVMVLDMTHEVWEWIEPGDWLEVVGALNRYVEIDTRATGLDIDHLTTGSPP